ncbi:hypothetical protein [Nannocystis pusilla]|uniref:hypothetical protein n=1 Tax=Nannocystis pusilla TaxID=889268 RepID=UPI003B76FA2B
MSHGYPLGAFNRFPASVLSRARFIASKRLEGLSLAAILALLNSEEDSREKAAPRAKAASKRAKAKTATSKRAKTKAKATSKRRRG